MKLIGNILFVEYQEILSFGVPEDTIKQGLSRSKRTTGSSWCSIADPEDGRKRLIRYSSIPATTIKKYDIPAESVFVEEIKGQQKKEKAEVVAKLPSVWANWFDGSDEKWFQDNYNVNYDPGKGNRARQLASVAAICRMVQACKYKADVQRITGLETKEEVYKAIAEHSSKLDLYGLPNNLRKIKEKISAFIKAEKEGKDGRETLVSKKFGNNNALVANEVHQMIIKAVYLQPHKPDLHESWTQYSHIVSEKYGNTPIKESRFKQLCNTSEMKLLASKSRNGSQYYETVIRPFHIHVAPQHSLSLISGDGWMPGTSVKHLFNGKKVVSGMNVWYWFDWKSGAIISWRISHAEDGHSIRQSFRDILHLHGGHCPISAMLDKKWEKQQDIRRMFEKAGVDVQAKRAYNPKSNKIERQNKEVNKMHRLFDEHWVNMTPGRSMQNRHNEEHLRGAKPMEYEEFADMVLTIFNTLNNTPGKDGKTPLEKLQASINPACKQFDPLQLTWIFGTRHPNPITVRNGLVKFQIGNKKYEYVLPAAAMKDFISRDVKYSKVMVYYDERHMETVDLYEYQDEKDEAFDRYLCTAESSEEYRYNSAQVEMTDEDWKKFHKNQERGKAVDELMQELITEQEDKMETYDLDRASVHAVSQERFKQANASALGKIFSTYYQDQERKGGKKVKVTQQAEISPREKFKKIKNWNFDEE